MPDVLIMATGEFRDPVILFICMKAGDGLLHELLSDFSIMEFRSSDWIAPTAASIAPSLHRPLIDASRNPSLAAFKQASRTFSAIICFSDCSVLPVPLLDRLSLMFMLSYNLWNRIGCVMCQFFCTRTGSVLQNNCS